MARCQDWWYKSLLTGPFQKKIKVYFHCYKFKKFQEKSDLIFLNNYFCILRVKS